MTKSTSEVGTVDLDPDSTSYYRPLGAGRYLPTLHTQGAWLDNEQHMAPVSGLLLHELELQHPRPDLQTCRVSYEILGMIPAVESEITTQVIRPGRTIELVEATMSAGGRPVVRATAWRLSRQDTSTVQGGQPDPLPAPEDCEPWDGTSAWNGGYIASLDIRVAPDARPGRVRAWLRSDKTLVEETTSCNLVRFIGLVDTANGIAVRVPPTTWMFPNTDLTIHLYRTPAGPWVGFDTEVIFGATGIGLTSTTLHDAAGPVGRAEQILTVRPLA